MKIMGIDIGGANTDCCIYEIRDNKIKHIESAKEYLPMWKEKENLESCLENFKKDYAIDVVIVTTTAELSDGYQSKKEGVLDIASKVINVFENSEIHFVTFNGLKDYDYVVKNPLEMAAANWIATSHIISKIDENCIFMDMGTTTTDIIPLKNGHEIAKGHSDLERLCSGELVYTGMLRTNVATIVNKIPINQEYSTVSSELFAISADVHTILGNITSDEYTCASPDNNDKTVIDCKRRLARVVCADLDMLTDVQIYNIAKYVEEKQINQVMDGLKKVSENNNIKKVIVSNYADSNICKKAAKKLNLDVSSLNEHLSVDSLNVSPTVGCIQMYLDKINRNISLIY